MKKNILTIEIDLSKADFLEEIISDAYSDGCSDGDENDDFTYPAYTLSDIVRQKIEDKLNRDIVNKVADKVYQPMLELVTKKANDDIDNKIKSAIDKVLALLLEKGEFKENSYSDETCKLDKLIRNKIKDYDVRYSIHKSIAVCVDSKMDSLRKEYDIKAVEKVVKSLAKKRLLKEDFVEFLKNRE